jgi:hypothetical protein
VGGGGSCFTRLHTAGGSGGEGPGDVVGGGGCLAGGNTRSRQRRVGQLEQESTHVGENRGGGATDGWGRLAQYRSGGQTTFKLISNQFKLIQTILKPFKL